MPGIRYEDLYAGEASESEEVQLKGRLDSALDGITCPGGEKRRVTGIMGRTANLGYLVARLAGKTLLTFALEVLNVAVDFAPLDIFVPEGQTLAFYEKSTSGAGVTELTVRYETE
jgi:hypothetical protein